MGDIPGKEFATQAELPGIGSPSWSGTHIDNPVPPGIDIHGTSYAA